MQKKDRTATVTVGDTVVLVFHFATLLYSVASHTTVKSSAGWNGVFFRGLFVFGGAQI